MLGLSMIAKNAEGSIEKAITSAKYICSQLLVIDTGSSDNTPKIATKNSADLHFYQWKDDFSLARNHALKLMWTEWVLILDSDEELVAESLQKNIKLLHNPNIGGINVLICNFLGDDKNSAISEHRYTRIFRNRKDIFFEGRIHEQVRESIVTANLEIVESDIIINHYGYSKNKLSRANRNIELLKKELEEKPSDVWTKFHLAESEFAKQELIKANTLYLAILNSPELSPEQNDIVRLRLAQIALKHNESQTTEFYLTTSCTNSDNEGLRLFIKAGYLMSLHKFKEAYEIYNNQAVRLSKLVDKNNLNFILSNAELFNV